MGVLKTAAEQFRRFLVRLNIVGNVEPWPEGYYHQGKWPDGSEDSRKRFLAFFRISK